LYHYLFAILLLILDRLKSSSKALVTEDGALEEGIPQHVDFRRARGFLKRQALGDVVRSRNPEGLGGPERMPFLSVMQIWRALPMPRKFPTHTAFRALLIALVNKVNARAATVTTFVCILPVFPDIQHPLSDSNKRAAVSAATCGFSWVGLHILPEFLVARAWTFAQPRATLKFEAGKILRFAHISPHLPKMKTTQFQIALNEVVIRSFAGNASSIARACQVPPSTISRLLSGKFEPTCETLETLAEVLNPDDRRQILLAAARDRIPSSFRSEIFGDEDPASQLLRAKLSPDLASVIRYLEASAMSDEVTAAYLRRIGRWVGLFGTVAVEHTVAFAGSSSPQTADEPSGNSNYMP
jgi:transcriptional regulator with XRE-family HTH domain